MQGQVQSDRGMLAKFRNRVECGPNKVLYIEACKIVRMGLTCKM
jgi:hypothetical protein